MHEMALCESMLRLIEEQSAAEKFSRVKTVWLEIGRLSHVEPEAMLFCFEAVTRGTLAEGARLEITHVSGQAWCMTCGKSVTLARRYDPCPDCGGHRLQVTEGEEMRIKELEVA